MATFEDFKSLDLRVGTIREAWLNPKARIPAYGLLIDFGPLGIKQSSAQLTVNYEPQTLLGKQVIAALGFPVKRVAQIDSEVLVLASVTEAEGTVLLQPERPVGNGARIR